MLQYNQNWTVSGDALLSFIGKITAPGRYKLHQKTTQLALLYDSVIRSFRAINSKPYSTLKIEAEFCNAPQYKDCVNSPIRKEAIKKRCPAIFICPYLYYLFSLLILFSYICLGPSCGQL